MSKERNNFLDTIRINGKNFQFFSLKKAEKILDFRLNQIPFTYRILLENLIRQEVKDLETLKKVVRRKSGTELFFSFSSFNARLHGCTGDSRFSSYER